MHYCLMVADIAVGIYQCGLVQERIAGDVLSLARIQLGRSYKSEVCADALRYALAVRH